MAGRSRYICCNLILNSSTPIDSFQSQSLCGSVNVGSAGIVPSAAYKIFPQTGFSWASSTCPLSPLPSSSYSPSLFFQARLYGGWGVNPNQYGPLALYIYYCVRPFPGSYKRIHFLSHAVIADCVRCGLEVTVYML